MKKKKQTNSSPFILLASGLILMIGLFAFLFLKSEDHILAKKQTIIVQKLKQDFSSETSVLNVLNVGGIALGKPLAILEIPSIDLVVPCFYGTSDEVLNEGIGLLEGFSDLDGGLGKHPVLTGHNGLSATRLFTRLDEMKMGEEFTLTTHKGKRIYKVSNLQVIKAEVLHADMGKYIKIDDAKNQITLITCTPRNVNSHRLLVTAQYVKDKQELGFTAKKILKHEKFQPLMYLKRFSMFVIVVAIVISLVIYLKIKNGGTR
jgi:sortase A